MQFHKCAIDKMQFATYADMHNYLNESYGKLNVLTIVITGENRAFICQNLFIILQYIPSDARVRFRALRRYYAESLRILLLLRKYARINQNVQIIYSREFRLGLDIIDAFHALLHNATRHQRAFRRRTGGV